jgi:hypothetical protein
MQEHQPTPHDIELLDACLTAIETQGLSLEECLAHYPAQGEALRPLLMTAQQLRQAASVQPSAAFRQQAAARLHARIAHSGQRKSQSRFRPALLPIGLAGAFAGLILVAFAGILLMTSQPQAGESAPAPTQAQITTTPAVASTQPALSNTSAPGVIAQGDPAGDEIDRLLNQLDALNNSADSLDDQP